MRILYFSAMLLISMCLSMQHQSVEAKPFIFKFFLPQAPAPARDSSSSTTNSTAIQFPDFLSTKLRLLTSLLQSGSGVSGGFNFGFKKFSTGTSITTTKRPNTSSTYTTPIAVFEPESTTQSSIKSTTDASSFDKTTEKTESESFSSSSTTDNSDFYYSTSKANTENSGYDYSTTKATTEKSGYDYSTAKVTTDNSGYDYSSTKANSENSGYDYSTAKVTTYKPDGYRYSTPKPSYNYPLPDSSMTENEISNEVIMINNQYLPSFY